MQRPPFPTIILSLVLLGVLLPIGPSAVAQDSSSCKDVEDQQPLRKIRELVAAPTARELSTIFDLQMKKVCVPTTTKVREREENGRTITTYKAELLDLRTYVYPYPNPMTGDPTWGYKDPITGDLMVSPGPTLRMRKANDRGQGGQGLAILLKNNLPANTAGCNTACPSTITCPVQPGGGCPASFLDPLVAACAGNSPPDNCCCVINCTQEPPNCYHGDNITNLHFHGTHASPQAPQDYVLLRLHPKNVDATEHADHGEGTTVAFGEYQYRVDPFRRTQPEGSHWYHPHKHGSVALQVANGLPGALIINGPFDDWLNDWYVRNLRYKPDEKVLVLQQIQETTNLFGQGGRPQVLVNGQVMPTVPMRRGEVQYWRFVNATMQAGTQLAIYFPPNTIVRQVAMDGVRFSPANYLCQPMYNPNANPPCNLTPRTANITLSPGNRADFLVQAPMVEGVLRVERKIVGNLGGQGGLRMMERDATLAPGAAEPGLVTIFVDDGDGKITPAEEAPPAMEAQMPPVDQWPRMPDYLRNIIPREVQGNPIVDLTFEQTVLDTRIPGPRANAVTKFKINNRQYNDDCVNVTTRLDVARQWEIKNTTNLAHPFHIHTNPFQLVVENGKPFRPEPIWLDTIGLPTGSTTSPGAVTLRQRYEEFTGRYVLHCHFLGHEDRGMMFGVQTVCKDRPDFFGQPGLVDECSGRLEKAADPCRTTADEP